MAGTPANRGAFFIQILSQQNSSWQGTITWTATQETQPFRSVLELLKLIDSALESGNSEEETK